MLRAHTSLGIVDPHPASPARVEDLVIYRLLGGVPRKVLLKL